MRRACCASRGRRRLSVDCSVASGAVRPETNRSNAPRPINSAERRPNEPNGARGSDWTGCGDIRSGCRACTAERRSLNPSSSRSFAVTKSLASMAERRRRIEVAGRSTMPVAAEEPDGDVRFWSSASRRAISSRRLSCSARTPSRLLDRDAVFTGSERLEQLGRGLPRARHMRDDDRAKPPLCDPESGTRECRGYGRAT